VKAVIKIFSFLN